MNIGTDKASDSLTSHNQEILTNYAKYLWNQEETQDAAPSIWNRVSSYFSSASVFGRRLGTCIAITHGAQLNNWVIDLVASKFFPESKPASGFEYLKQKIFGVAKNSFVESLKLIATPKMMPFYVLGGAALGELTWPAIVGILTILYGKVFSDPAKLSQLKTLSLDQLLNSQVDGSLYTAFGEELSTEQIQDIQKLISQYNLVCKLNEMKPAEIADFINSHYLFTQKAEPYDKQFYLNGDLVSESDREAIAAGIRQLSEKNDSFLSSSRELKDQAVQRVRKMITLLTASHLPNFLSVNLDPEHWSNYLTQCVDEEGTTYCVRQDILIKKEGKFIDEGEILTDSDREEILSQYPDEKEEYIGKWVDEEALSYTYYAKQPIEIKQENKILRGTFLSTMELKEVMQEFEAKYLASKQEDHHKLIEEFEENKLVNDEFVSVSAEK